jgi:hypothetical protein
MKTDVKLMKSAFSWGLILATGGLLSGCLLLAEKPVYEIGEECEKSSHCAKGAFCAVPEGYDSAICVPEADECNSVDDERCGTFACSMGSVNLCNRRCEAADDCRPGHLCRLSDCVVDPNAPMDQCTAADSSSCGGYICSAGRCLGVCTDEAGCAPEYTCYNFECVLF